MPKATELPATDEGILEDLLRQVRARYQYVRRKAPGCEEQFLEHVRLLAQFHKRLSYPDVARVKFPDTLPIAFAVCRTSCGSREFIVEGNTQECDHCGGPCPVPHDQ